jgi:acylphosphatase
MMDLGMNGAIRVRIRGRVQGVGYRAWAGDAAAELGLRGWVRNRRDGSVEALLIGPREAITAMIERCRRGPALARVDAIAQEEAADDGEPGFRQLPTE